jgi:hypothetical protein
LIVGEMNSEARLWNCSKPEFLKILCSNIIQ